MANWQRKILLNPEWDATDEDDPRSIQKLSASIITKLRALATFPGRSDINEWKDTLIEEFEILATDEGATKEDFDDVMCQLYDWSDQPLDTEFGGKKVCWVDVFTHVDKPLRDPATIEGGSHYTEAMLGAPLK